MDDFDRIFARGRRLMIIAIAVKLAVFAVLIWLAVYAINAFSR